MTDHRPALERHYVPGLERDRLLGDDGEPGFDVEALLGIEGPGWLVEHQWEDPSRREHLMFAARVTEAEPVLAGLSSHLLAAAVRP